MNSIPRALCFKNTIRREVLSITRVLSVQHNQGYMFFSIPRYISFSLPRAPGVEFS